VGKVGGACWKPLSTLSVARRGPSWLQSPKNLPEPGSPGRGPLSDFLCGFLLVKRLWPVPTQFVKSAWRIGVTGDPLSAPGVLRGTFWTTVSSSLISRCSDAGDSFTPLRAGCPAAGPKAAPRIGRNRPPFPRLPNGRLRSSALQLTAQRFDLKWCRFGALGRATAAAPSKTRPFRLISETSIAIRPVLFACASRARPSQGPGLSARRAFPALAVVARICLEVRRTRPARCRADPIGSGRMDKPSDFVTGDENKTRPRPSCRPGRALSNERHPAVQWGSEAPPPHAFPRRGLGAACPGPGR